MRRALDEGPEGARSLARARASSTAGTIVPGLVVLLCVIGVPCGYLWFAWRGHHGLDSGWDVPGQGMGLIGDVLFVLVPLVALLVFALLALVAVLAIRLRPVVHPDQTNPFQRDSAYRRHTAYGPEMHATERELARFAPPPGVTAEEVVAEAAGIATQTRDGTIHGVVREVVVEGRLPVTATVVLWPWAGHVYASSYAEEWPFARRRASRAMKAVVTELEARGCRRQERPAPDPTSDAPWLDNA